MPRNEQSEKRKQHIVSLLEKRLGPCCRKHPHRTDWYSSMDGTVDVFITDSKPHYSKRPWFDMRADDLKELAMHHAGFIIFILGEENSYLVIPAKDVDQQIPNHQERLTSKGFYHFNVALGKRVFEQLPAWDLYQYLRKIESLPQKL